MAVSGAPTGAAALMDPAEQLEARAALLESVQQFTAAPPATAGTLIWSSAVALPHVWLYAPEGAGSTSAA